MVYLACAVFWKPVEDFIGNFVRDLSDDFPNGPFVRDRRFGTMLFDSLFHGGGDQLIEADMLPFRDFTGARKKDTGNCGLQIFSVSITLL